MGLTYKLSSQEPTLKPGMTAKAKNQNVTVVQTPLANSNEAMLHSSTNDIRYIDLSSMRLINFEPITRFE